MKEGWVIAERKGTTRGEQRCQGGVEYEVQQPQRMSENVTVEAISLCKDHSPGPCSSEDKAHGIARGEMDAVTEHVSFTVGSL